MINLSVSENTAFLEMNTNRHNSFDTYFLETFLVKLNEIKRNSDLRVIVLRGSDYAFCTGADLSSISKYTKSELTDFFFLLDNLLFQVNTFPKPIIAQVSGHAIGGGLALLLATDYSIVSGSSKSKFGFPEYKMGMSLTPSMLELVLMQKLDGHEHILLGRLINASEAFKLGWFSEQCDDDINSRTGSIINEYLDIPHDSFLQAKQSLDKRIKKPQREINSASYAKLYDQVHEYLSKIGR